jgi:hypothetical protein
MPVQTCPHCEHRTEDVFELLGNNIVHEMRACEHCGKPFLFAIIECEHCGHEEAFAKPAQLVLTTLRAAACPACRRTFALADDGLPELF